MTPAAIAFVVAVATQRHASKRDSIRESSFYANSSFGSHYIGVLGELAVTKVYGGKVNQEILAHGDKHAPDLVLNGNDGREIGIEVKTSAYRGNQDVDLKMNKVEFESDSEFWCLVHVHLPEIAFVYPMLPASEGRLLAKIKYFNGRERHTVAGNDILQACGYPKLNKKGKTEC